MIEKKSASHRYRKIECRMWGDEKFCSLSPLLPSGQALWIYLLTGPHTNPIPGLFRSGKAAMAEDLSWSLEEFEESFQEVFREGMSKADWKSKVVWVKNAIFCNKPASPNVILSWSTEWDSIPECELKMEAYEFLKIALRQFGENYFDAFIKACRKPSLKASRKAFDNPFDKPSGKGEGKGDWDPPRKGQNEPSVEPSVEPKNEEVESSIELPPWRGRKASGKPSRKPSRKASPNQEQEQEQEQEQDLSQIRLFNDRAVERQNFGKEMGCDESNAIKRDLTMVLDGSNGEPIETYTKIESACKMPVSVDSSEICKNEKNGPNFEVENSIYIRSEKVQKFEPNFEVVQKVQKVQKVQISSNEPGSNLKSAFNKFWIAYPRKQSKKKSQDLWKRKKLDKMIDVILDDLSQRTDWNAGSEFTPLPTSYLNGERWEDEEKNDRKKEEKVHKTPAQILIEKYNKLDEIKGTKNKEIKNEIV